MRYFLLLALVYVTADQWISLAVAQQPEFVAPGVKKLPDGTYDLTILFKRELQKKEKCQCDNCACDSCGCGTPDAARCRRMPPDAVRKTGVQKSKKRNGLRKFFHRLIRKHR